MKVFHTFFCFLFMALQDGNTEFVNEENKLFRRLEGENITVECPFPFSGHTKLLCKKNCDVGNILLETTEDDDQRGRFSIEYEHRPSPSDDIMHVTIKQLTRSDSGWYRCALKRYSFPGPYRDFEIVVTEASTTSQPKSTLPTFPSSTFLPSVSTATTPTEESLSSTSGRSEPPSTSTESSEQLDSSPPRSDLHLCMGLILVVKIFILSMPLMILCKKRRSTKPEVPPVDMNNVNVSESRRVIEEIREDRQISSPPVEESTIYCNINYTKQS